MRPIDHEEMQWLLDILREPYTLFTRETVIMCIDRKCAATVILSQGLGRPCEFTYEELVLVVTHWRMTK